MDACLLCRAREVVQLIDFGMQPICNRFPATPDAEEALFPMRLGQCGACGVVQAIAPPPAAELKPRVDWITYNEPEGHLDRLAVAIAGLPGLTKDSSICGITFKDDSLLRRLHDEHGFAHTWRLDFQKDLGIAERGVGVETIQDRLTGAATEKIAQAHGKADVVIARHIWEHTSDPAGFVDALKNLMTPHGYLVIEIPDCERALAGCDYSTVWEEHSLYFTDAAFRLGISRCGLSLEYLECFPYALENSLVAIARINSGAAPARDSEEILEAEKRRGQGFAGGLAGQREKLANYFARFQKERGRIAILGAGHLACTFVNLLGLKQYIDFVADDNPHKLGLCMPGSRLPILGSGALLERGVKLCLLSVNAESEEKVIQKNRPFVEAGGSFQSIFPASKHGLRV